MLKASSMDSYEPDSLFFESSHILFKQTAHRNKHTDSDHYLFISLLTSTWHHCIAIDWAPKLETSSTEKLHKSTLQVINSCFSEIQIEKKQIPFSSPVFLLSSGSTFTSWRMRGLRVTMPVPRGRRSLPTKLSSTELFPLLCDWDEPQNKQVSTD